MVDVQPYNPLWIDSRAKAVVNRQRENGGIWLTELDWGTGGVGEKERAGIIRGCGHRMRCLNFTS